MTEEEEEWFMADVFQNLDAKIAALKLGLRLLEDCTASFRAQWALIQEARFNLTQTQARVLIKGNRA